jgi:hypothetical protein
MIRRITKSSTLALLLAGSVAACDNATRPGAESVVLLSGSASASFSLGAEALASLTDGGAMLDDGSLASVTVGSVHSIHVRVTGVQALPANLDENSEAAWVSLSVQGGGEFDLMQLSVAAVELARGELEAGTYQGVRLFFDEASITFHTPVTVGAGPAARTYEADVAHPLSVPSGAQTGIKVPTAGFVVTESTGDVVTVEFEAAATVQSLQALPHGIQMSPVLTAR